MSLKEFADKELETAGWKKEDGLYGDMIYKAVMEIVEVFDKQNHSGMSAGIVIAIINKLLRFKSLMPVKKEDFVEVAEGVWQCSRDSELFLTSDKTGYYNVSDKSKITRFENV